MFDQVALWLEQYPYLGAAILFLLCGIGLPLPEEIVLLAAGYVCARWPDNATLWLMMVWCGGAILAGDLIPFVLGRTFGTRLLRVRWMRMLVTKRRLAMFDRWFRRRGDMVILIARFIAGLRMVAFFTAGIMKMPWRRFLLLDGLGILLIVPLLTWLGYHSQAWIDELIHDVQKVERGILWGALGAAVLVGVWYWIWRRRKTAARRRATGEAFVQPSRPVAQEGQEDQEGDDAELAAAETESTAEESGAGKSGGDNGTPGKTTESGTATPPADNSGPNAAAKPARAAPPKTNNDPVPPASGPG